MLPLPTLPSLTMQGLSYSGQIKTITDALYHIPAAPPVQAHSAEASCDVACARLVLRCVLLLSQQNLHLHRYSMSPASQDAFWKSGRSHAKRMAKRTKEETAWNGGLVAWKTGALRRHASPSSALIITTVTMRGIRMHLAGRRF